MAGTHCTSDLFESLFDSIGAIYFFSRYTRNGRCARRGERRELPPPDRGRGGELLSCWRHSYHVCLQPPLGALLKRIEGWEGWAQGVRSLRHPALGRHRTLRHPSLSLLSIFLCTTLSAIIFMMRKGYRKWKGVVMRRCRGNFEFDFEFHNFELHELKPPRRANLSRPLWRNLTATWSRTSWLRSSCVTASRQLWRNLTAPQVQKSSLQPTPQRTDE
jgi:hypothetical protein